MIQNDKIAVTVLMECEGTSRESYFSRRPVSAACQKVIRSDSSRVPMQQYDLSEHFRYSGDIHIYIYTLSHACIPLQVYRIYYLVNFLCAGLNKRQMLSEQLQRFHFSIYLRTNIQICISIELEWYFSCSSVQGFSCKIQIETFFSLLILVVLYLGQYQ